MDSGTNKGDEQTGLWNKQGMSYKDSGTQQGINT
eukprot:CAMPEP_0117424714 /NCGR_PEP_ID=MMETSP0758-20121206/5091_1 /TAXON_ID=63605 /ORGANISM="Percolomonas cosmopolitus, Strain AE-1 (ATCC 50343)" /LENGTH=33 /DNA_ID= /DNA_START= /DNA_END= /DNA_ORIENTATION=